MTKISMQELYSELSLSKIHGEGKIKQFQLPPQLLLRSNTKFGSLSAWGNRGSMLLSLSRQVQCPGTVSCSDLWMENPGRYFVCAAFNSLACWAHSCTSCSSACWDLTTGTLHCGKDGSRLELNLPA